jgi:Ca-activated chloride channel family protein
VRRLSAGLALFVAAAVLSLQAQTPTAKIASPAEGSYVTGPVRLVMAFDPLSVIPEVRLVRWFADGRQVCTVELQPFSCDWDAGTGVAEHAIRAVAVLKDGTSIVASARTKAVEYAESVDVDVIQLTAVVTDGDGHFVSGLKAQDFRVSDDDKPQRLSSFTAEETALELVTAIDVSSSMTGALPAVKRQAVNFLSQLRPADQVTLLGFNDNIITLARRSTEQAVREKAIARLAPWGGTALYDVIIRALDLLGRQPGRRSLLVFSDGDDQSSHATMPAVVSRAQASDATIYMIGQGRALKASTLQQLMRQLAHESGGRAFFSDQDHKLETIFQEILDDLRHQYLLSYPAPEHARDGAAHRLKVEVPGKGYTVRARLGYRVGSRVPQ